MGRPELEGPQVTPKFAPAVRVGGKIFPGVNHGEAMLDAEEATGMNVDDAEQGFLDENGDFVSRADVAQRSGMPPRTFATSEDLTPSGAVNPLDREPGAIIKRKGQVVGRIEPAPEPTGYPQTILQDPTGGVTGKIGGSIYEGVPEETPKTSPPITPKKGLGEAGRIGITKVFHGTTRPGFDVPTLGYSGVHVGTPGQAADFTGATGLSRIGAQPGGRVIPLWAKVAKEIQMRDLGGWAPGKLIDEAEKAGGLPSDLAQNLRTIVDQLRTLYNEDKLTPQEFVGQESAVRNEVLKAIRDQGYDAISYQNVAEGPRPAESMIILDPLANLKNALAHPTPEAAFPEAQGLPVGQLEDVPLGRPTTPAVELSKMLIGLKTAFDLVEPTSGVTILKAGGLITPEVAETIGKSFSSEAIDDIYDTAHFPEEEGFQPAPNLAPREIIGKPLDADVVDNATGKVLVPRGTIVTKEIYKQLNLMPGSWSLIGKGAMPMLGGMTIGSGGALALMLKLQQMRQGKNK